MLPNLSNKFLSIEKKGQQLFDTGLEMFKAYSTQGKSAGDVIMKREGTGLDACAENLAQEVSQIENEIIENCKLIESTSATIINNIIYILYGIGLILFIVIVYVMSLIVKRVSPLDKILIELKNNSSSLSLQSKDLSDSATDMSSSSNSQSSALHQSASALEQIKSISDKTEGNVKILENLTLIGKEKVQYGVEKFTDLATVNEKLNQQIKIFIETVEKTNAEFSQTSNIVKEIIDKTKIINDIVFQTKLLSFNASVEAARAGEAGKGFAVVAEEIGNLANMSGQASKEISEILSQSQQSVERSVHDSTASLAQLIQVTDHILNEAESNVNTGRTSLDEIQTSYEDLFNTIHEIVRAIREQSLGISEINSAINTLNTESHKSIKLAYENSDISKNVGNSANQILEISHDLRKIIS